TISASAPRFRFLAIAPPPLGRTRSVVVAPRHDHGGQHLDAGPRSVGTLADDVDHPERLLETALVRLQVHPEGAAAPAVLGPADRRIRRHRRGAAVEREGG